MIASFVKAVAPAFENVNSNLYLHIIKITHDVTQITKLNLRVYAPFNNQGHIGTGPQHNEIPDSPI